jgi:hypothetical protein
VGGSKTPKRIGRHVLPESLIDVTSPFRMAECMLGGRRWTRCSSVWIDCIGARRISGRGMRVGGPGQLCGDLLWLPHVGNLAGIGKPHVGTFVLAVHVAIVGA